MNVPEDLRYSSEHEWVRVDGDTATIGITDYAQDALGDVVFVELPSLDQDVEAHASVAEIESTKSVSEIYAPVAGTVVAVNDALENEPELVNRDPYGEGWIFRVRPNDGADFSALLDAQAYRATIES